jgi:excisionase family DNA binding protein
MNTIHPEPAESYQHWITPKEASRILGVHPTTLRLWTRQGKLLAYRTPGGHRRFDLRDIQRLLEEGQRQTQETVMHYTVEKALAVARSQVTGQLIPREYWYQQVPDDARSYHRELGRRMLGLLVQYVARENSHERIIAEGRRVAANMAAHNMRMGLSLTDAVRAFMYFRDSLIDALVPALSSPGEMDEDDLVIYRKARTFMNDMLCTLLESFAQAGLQSSSQDALPPSPPTQGQEE